MGHETAAVIIIQLLVFTALSTANTFESDDFGVPTDSDQVYGQDPVQTTLNENHRPLSLDDILNLPVGSRDDLCPTEDVLMFFSSGNLEYLRNCYERALRRNNFTNPTNSRASSMTSSSTQSGRAPEMTSYSGRLLKRILQNMDGGTRRVDFSRMRNRRPTPDKRTRLSINGALSSLVDMLKYESAHPRGPKYAFHSDLLHMG